MDTAGVQYGYRLATSSINRLPRGRCSRTLSVGGMVRRECVLFYLRARGPVMIFFRPKTDLTTDLRTKPGRAAAPSARGVRLSPSRRRVGRSESSGTLPSHKHSLPLPHTFFLFLFFSPPLSSVVNVPLKYSQPQTQAHFRIYEKRDFQNKSSLASRVSVVTRFGGPR